MTATDEMPRAWMGYKAGPKRFAVVRVCAYCPDKAAADKLARDAGFEVTHSICPACFQEQQARIIPDF